MSPHAKKPAGRAGPAVIQVLDWGPHRPVRKPRLVSQEERKDFKLELCNRMEGRKRREYRHALKALFAAGFLGVGFGVKVCEKKCRILEARCVRVYVREKLAKSALTRAQLIPEKVNGLPTDVIALPDLRTEAVPCGTIVGYRMVTAGTIGCLVEKAGRRYVLSNNHVLADSNAAKIGDSILAPAMVPGPFATLADFQPLDFTKGARNDMDAAIAEILAPASVDPRINLLGSLSPQITTAYPGLAVKKSGITTAVTDGLVEAYDEDIRFPYSGGRIAGFRAQVAVRGLGRPFSEKGDSGSLVVTEAGRRPVGLLVGSAPIKGLSFCTPLQRVLDQFHVTLVTA
jgi:hypothetical protein